MVGHGGSSAGSYLTDPASPISSHCASIVATSTLRVNSVFQEAQTRACQTDIRHACECIIRPISEHEQCQFPEYITAHDRMLIEQWYKCRHANIYDVMILFLCVYMTHQKKDT